MSNEFPPKRRNWKQGSAQVGAMIRTKLGSTISLANDEATDRQEVLVFAMILDIGEKRIPDEIMTKLTEWVDGQIKRSKT